MKRSDMIKIMVEELTSHSPNELYVTVCENILTVMEKEGMIPPQRISVTKGIPKLVRECWSWENEND